jgi:hypothetical protein
MCIPAKERHLDRTAYIFQEGEKKKDLKLEITMLILPSDAFHSEALRTFTTYKALITKCRAPSVVVLCGQPTCNPSGSITIDDSANSLQLA